MIGALTLGAAAPEWPVAWKDNLDYGYRRTPPLGISMHGATPETQLPNED